LRAECHVRGQRVRFLRRVLNYLPDPVRKHGYKAPSLALGKSLEIQIGSKAKPASSSNEGLLGGVGVAGAGRTRCSGLTKVLRLAGRKRTSQ
jgi:hypothetical protein